MELVLPRHSGSRAQVESSPGTAVLSRMKTWPAWSRVPVSVTITWGVSLGDFSPSIRSDVKLRAGRT